MCPCCHKGIAWNEHRCYQYPSVDFPAYCDDADDADDTDVFDSSAYFAPYNNGYGCGRCLLNGGSSPVAIVDYGFDRDDENLAYMTAAWWEGVGDHWCGSGRWRQNHVQEGVYDCSLVAGVYVETKAGAETELEVEAEEGWWSGSGIDCRIGRDSWECDFCGPECFCWTVDERTWVWGSVL